MKSRRRTALLLSYLGVSLIGWLLFGIFLRAQLDLIGADRLDVLGLAMVALYGAVVLFGTPVGYLVIRLATWDWGADAERHF
ncbi:hypothetical protein HQQ81_20340 [Microbacteriaceae bacterium VKM Ac-2854]|nr:hypothetical protein [Microbacteriaceae bacterium VKM Ac-2854]